MSTDVPMIPHAPIAAVRAADDRVHLWMARHGVALLRVAVGLVFLGFGVLKLFPGVSPAQDLVETTTHVLFLGLVPGGVALVFVAALECLIGLSLVTGVALPFALLLLGGEFVGILSPLVLLPGRLFAGPHHAPTLEGQYVLKDVILVAAAIVIAVVARGGALSPCAEVSRRDAARGRSAGVRRWRVRAGALVPAGGIVLALVVVALAAVAGSSPAPVTPRATVAVRVPAATTTAAWRLAALQASIPAAVAGQGRPPRPAPSRG